jgi:hypothetical protein
MKKIPAPIRIFLNQTGVEPGDKFADLEGVTWSEERIFDEDVEYIRFDEVEKILIRVAEMWGNDYPGRWVGVSVAAKEILEKRENENTK